MTDIQTTTFTPQGPAKLTFLCPNELVLWLERWAQVRSQTVPEVLCDLVSAAVGHNRPADTEQPDPRQDAIGVIRLARSLLDGFPAYDTPTQPENAIKKNTHPGYTWIAFRCARAVYDEWKSVAVVTRSGGNPVGPRGDHRLGCFNACGQDRFPSRGDRDRKPCIENRRGNTPRRA